MLLSNAVGNLNHEFESCAPLNWDLDMQFDVIRDFKVCKKKKKKILTITESVLILRKFLEMLLLEKQNKRVKARCSVRELI